ncbi:DUF3488 and transglutaminase-like domain-containing protein [Massilia sp. PAMC28688]|uniref:transglutaminase family protein n=1 Tax=Massilia sp. PAMC28688 TaxID=2861283 RepID=UPI001C62D042|nr:DUF3488 and transglutaminase-like domain-containing protein [Massilia sp. PAMC28688]QYF94053.1 DUF3488 and transglutaminase-like domain-containing protein [Massilia sp. PAMC28688]
MKRSADQQAPHPAAALPQGRLARLQLTLSRDKSDTLLLLAATVLVLAPHALHLPLWVTLLCATTLAWRALITFRGTRMPPTLLLLPLAIAAMGGILLTFKTLLGREAGVAMVVLLVTFKLLEMHARRDLFVVIYLCFFVLLTNFFYSQSIGMGAMMCAAVVALLTAQLSFQYSGAVPPLLRRLGLAARTLALAAPLAVALFLLFPRVQGPLWGMPGDAGAGRTGLSNSMAPGNIASLAESSEIAFRVKFQGQRPAQSQLYWRGVVLSEFDGRTWTQPPRRDWRATADTLVTHGQPVNYQVTLEPHREQWLFALDMPTARPRMPNMGSWMTGSMELRAGIGIERRVRYDAQSHPSYTLDGGATLPRRERWLALPGGFNPVATSAGLQLRSEPDPAKRVNAVLAMFRRDGFSYTMQPPLLAANTVDDFLYRTKAGFCEHYASAFVFLMRAAGVPARVVTGYQGGEHNPVDDFVTVRQSDAHAWAEVWLGQRGWVRVDPTAAIAPERIERNLQQALPDQYDLPGMEGMISLGERNPWLARLRFQLSAFSNGWDQWVLSYDQQRRSSVLEGVKDALGNWRTAGAIAALCLLLAAAGALQRRRRQDPVEALYGALGTILGRHGMTRGPGEGPNAWAARVAGSTLAASKKEAALRFLQLYSAHKYGPDASAPGLVSTLKKLLNGTR